MTTTHARRSAPWSLARRPADLLAPPVFGRHYQHRGAK